MQYMTSATSALSLLLPFLSWKYLTPLNIKVTVHFSQIAEASVSKKLFQVWLVLQPQILEFLFG